MLCRNTVVLFCVNLLDAIGEWSKKPMARYCFYCGKELSPGEKCHCRERTYVTSARDGTASQHNSDASTDQEYAGHSAKNDASTSGAPETNTGATGSTGSASFHSTPSKHEQRRAEREARRQEKARKKQEKRQKQKSESSYTYRQHSNYQSTPGQGRQAFARVLRFIVAPADTLEETLSPIWSTSHTVWFALAVALSGLLYVNLYRWTIFMLVGKMPTLSAGRIILSWLTGSVFVLGILVLYTFTLWLIARFLFRQGNFPFLHALAAGRSSWKYLVIFLLFALPSTLSAGSLYGIILAIIGLVFSIILHARLVAKLTHLDENRTIQLILLSIIVFAGLCSTATLFFNMIQPV